MQVDHGCLGGRLGVRLPCRSRGILQEALRGSDPFVPEALVRREEVAKCRDHHCGYDEDVHEYVDAMQHDVRGLADERGPS